MHRLPCSAGACQPGEVPGVFPWQEESPFFVPDQPACLPEGSMHLATQGALLGLLTLSSLSYIPVV